MADIFLEGGLKVGALTIFWMVILIEDKPEIAELSRATDILFNAVLTTQLAHVADAKLIYDGKKIFSSLMSTAVVEKTEGCLIEKV
jgi:hypothetical protein